MTIDIRDEASPETAVAPQLGIAVEHRSRLATGVALAAAAMTVAWFARALQTGEVLAWAWCLVLGVIAVVELLVVRDGRAPLLLADDQGVRVRTGETWAGLRWPDIDHVDVQSPSSWARDGSIVVHPRLAELDEEPTPESLFVSLGATTRIRYDGLTGDLVADLDALASGRTPVVVVTRLEPVEEPEAPANESEGDETPVAQELVEASVVRATAEAPRIEAPTTEAPVVHSEVEVVVLGASDAEGLVLPRQATAEERDQAVENDDAEVDEAAEPTQPTRERKEGPTLARPELRFPPVEPVRETRRAARSEVVRNVPRRPAAAPIPAQRGAGSPIVVAPVDDLAAAMPRPAAEARIGPIVAAARNRARLSIDTLSERTRIRPHVLECIEVDDFAPCGGDFYARGHLRTLARIFGLDAQELLSLYDEHYASPEIEAKQVFEAELATGIGGGMRATSTGPRWSVLAAAVVMLGLVWGAATFLSDEPEQIVSPAPNVDSAGLARSEPSAAPKSTLAALEVSAEGASPQVVVRDRDGRILWAGELADGKRQQVIGLAPFDVTASNGQAVKVSFLGKSKGTVGDSDTAASKQFGEAAD